MAPVKSLAAFFFLSLTFHAAILALPFPGAESRTEKIYPIAFLTTERPSPVTAPATIETGNKFRDRSAQAEPQPKPLAEPRAATPRRKSAAAPALLETTLSLPLETGPAAVERPVSPAMRHTEALAQPKPEAKPNPARRSSRGLNPEAAPATAEARASGNAAPPATGAAAGQPGAVSEPRGVFSQAQYAHNPPPEYPELARRQGLKGTVLLSVLVGREGTPQKIELKQSSGYATLDRAALSAVRGWRFHPAREDEKTVPSWVQIPIVFRLAEIASEVKLANH